MNGTLDLPAFHRWALGDLMDNANRGLFAEWLVSQLLGIPLEKPRDSWAVCDLVTATGVMIEVKSAAYLQTWKQKGVSKIVFTGLRSGNRGADAPMAKQSNYNADWYFFCLQIEQDRTRWNAQDLDQWRFFILSRADLRRLDLSSISLATLKKHAQELTADQLRSRRKSLVTVSGT